MQEGNTSLNVVTENYFMCRILNTLTSLAILMTESHAQFCCKSLCYIMLFKLRNKKCLILQSGLTDIRRWYRCAAERCMIRIVLILIGNIFCSNKVTAELQSSRLEKCLQLRDYNLNWATAESILWTFVIELHSFTTHWQCVKFVKHPAVNL